MTIRLTCPNCQATLQVAAENAGKQGRCPKCSTVMPIPKAAPQSKASAIPSLPTFNPEADAGFLFGWFKRITRGSPTEIRDLQRYAQKKLSQLNSLREQLHDSLQVADKDARGAVANLVESQRQQVLRGTSTDVLSSSIGPKTLSLLQQQGYRKLSDLSKASSSTLQQVRSVGPATATRITNAVSKMVQQVDQQPVTLPPPDEITSQYRALLAALSRRVTSLRVPTTLTTSLDHQSQQLKQRLRQAAHTTSLWHRIFSKSSLQHKQVAAHQPLMDLLQSYSQDDITKPAIAIVNALSVNKSFAEVQQEYQDRYADFFSVLEGYIRENRASVGMQPALEAGERGVIPKEIADRVEKLDLVLDGLRVQLRGYQQFGTKYMVVQKKTILGDEMGLGKTIQAMAAMAHLQATENASRFVVVAPASILGNWVRELEERTDLRVHLLHGPAREVALQDWVDVGGIAVTSYATLLSLRGVNRHPIHLLIADEAHYIKNPDARRTKNVWRLAQVSDRITLMTGTPLENRPEEFVNLIHFCDTNLAGSLSDIDAQLDSGVARQFERRVAPVYLRRNQEDVLHELPECLEKEEWVSLADEDERGYLRLLQGTKPNLMTLRQATLGTAASSDGKLKRLREIIEDYRASGQKVVIFSFFLNTLKAVGDLVGE